MYYEFSSLDWHRSYKLMASTVVPRPIAWVVTIGEAGNINAAPFSFFNYFAGMPPVICIGMTDTADGQQDSLVNIKRDGEFVVNLVSEKNLEAMNTTAITFPPAVSEIEMAKLKTLPSTLVTPPRIEGSPVALECRLTELVRVMGDTGYIVLAHVVGMHIDDAAVLDKEKCYVDTASLGLVGRMESPGTYVRTKDRISLRTPSLAEWRSKRDASSEFQ